MYLIYINEIGMDYKGQKQYEFLFSENVDDIESILVEDWFERPASGNSTPPDEEFIDVVGLLKDTYLDLDLVQKSNYFAVIDSVDNIIALGWEKYDEDSEDVLNRLSFHFGENYESVTGKLIKKGLNLIKQEIKYSN